MTNPYGQQHHGGQYDPYGGSSYPQATPGSGFPQNMPPAPQYPYSQPGAPGYGYPPMVRPTHPLATASLILSLVGVSCGLTAVGGVITGHMARKRLREEPYYDGHGMALAGVIIGWIITGFMALVLAFYIVIIVLGLSGAFE